MDEFVLPLGVDLIKVEHMQDSIKFDITTNLPMTEETKPENIIEKKVVFYDGIRFYISKEGYADARLGKWNTLNKRVVIKIPSFNINQLTIN